MPVGVAYVTAHCPFGAAETFAIAELVELQRQGIDLHLFPVRRDGPVLHAEALALLPVTHAPGLLSPEVLSGALMMMIEAPLRVIRAALDMTVGQRPRVIIKNLAVLPKGLWLGRELRRRGIRHVHAYWSSTAATIAYIAATLANVPLSLTAHSWDISEDNALEQKIRRSVVTRVIADDGISKLSTRVSGEALGRVRKIHLGVAVPPNVPEPESRERLVIAVPASLRPVKGHAYLLAALEQLRDEGIGFECLLFGEGPLRPQLERTIEGASLGDVVRLEGQVPHDALMARFASGAFDVVVLPSVSLPDDVREGIPIGLVEAMANGIPVVATATGGIPELLADGAGSIVQERDSGSMADALRALLEDQTMRRALGLAGRRRVVDEFESSRQTALLLTAMGLTPERLQA